MIREALYNGEWKDVLDSWGEFVTFWHEGEVIKVQLSELSDYRYH